MQKIINGIAIFSGAVALGVVGLGGYAVSYTHLTLPTN